MPLPGPDTRVVELRVPGLIGTSGESLLDSVDTVDVAGDGVGRIIRPSDRLRRPAPGPMLQALGRSLPRTVEGYLWNRMTSGGMAKTAWALLFPFSLANVAHWMLPPVPEGSRLATAIGTVCRALLRIAALLLTVLLVTQLAVVSLDLVAVQCLAPGSTCVPFTPSWIRDVPPMRTVVGVLPLLAVIFVLYRVSSAAWTVNAPERVRNQGPELPGDDLVDGTDTALLRSAHTVAALACVALLLLGGPLRVPGSTAELVLWVVTLTVLGCTLLAATTRAHRLLGAVIRVVLLIVALGLVVTAAVLRTPLPSALTGTNDAVQVVGAALLAVCVLFGVLLVPAALLARPAWAALPRRLRPWAGGWAAAPALALAGLLGGGFGAGLAIALRQLIGTGDLLLPPSYTLVTLLWGTALPVAALLAGGAFAVAIPLRRLRRGVPEVVRLLQNGKQERAAAATAWARASWERKYLHRMVLGFVLTMAVGVAVLLAVRFGAGSVPGRLAPFSGVGVLALGALAAGLLRVVYTTATGPERSRHLGAFADLVCFWPRAAHPAVPPSYPLKVVPEVAERAREHLAEPNTRVVLAGYHIGGLLAVVAASRLVADLPAEDRERVGVLTGGAPLQWGYQRAFPAVLPHESLTRFYGRLDGRWRGLCRGTDTFGGGATTWRHQVVDGKLLGMGYLPDGGVGALPAAVRGPTGALVLGGDHWLPDPITGPLNGRRWVAGVRRHADYVADPEWDRAVIMAAGLEDPDTTKRLAEQVPLFGDLLGQPRCH
ncbi:hypothetical protein [Qaidamihabitans albus]|uniref:hypothetical protein n=1 Tax=Qaidamihabitans albus TaxID=2795733 RepID=UPI0018F1134E|nr:hypothetical protein [Qaidamihabitans albus]